MTKPQQSREEIMAILSEAIEEFGDVYRLAIRTGLSQGCINNIRKGKTQWPRFPTMESLMVVLNLRLVLQKG